MASALDRAAQRVGWQVAARVLVAYATKLGSTAEIAEAMAQGLRDGGHQALAVPAREVTNLDDWDAVVLGSALYSATWQRDARKFVDRFRDKLATRPLWLFSSGPLDRHLARADQPLTPNAAQIMVGLEPRSHHTFGGRLSVTADVPPQVLQTHRLGDFREWQRIVAYAYQIGRELDRMGFRKAT